jgi:DNA helicase-2/ATP-dependent DNA helicase PcrA
MMNGSTQYNQKSRFANEIPPWLIAEDDRTYSSFGSFSSASSYQPSYSTTLPKRAGNTPIYNHGGPGSGYGTGEERAAYSGNIPTKKASANSGLPSFNKGDRVRHATFGAGTILSARTMGGDTLYEVEFDTVGTKKLMASFARLKKD